MTAKALTYLKWGFFLLFVNIHVGRWDLLPGFLGILLLLQALRSQEMTETERRLCPLLVIWMIDQFLHWGWEFQNGLESLIIAVLNIYIMYILLGEIGLRVEKEWPKQAHTLHFIRISLTILLVLGYLVGAYQNKTFALLLSLATITLLVRLLWVLFQIKPINNCI